MLNLNRQTEKKVVGDKRFYNEVYEPNVENIKKVITDEVYNTKGEVLILAKGVNECRIVLDSETTEHIIIKALTKVYITPSSNKIDEYYDEIFIDRGACVEFYLIENNWYIVSSDGLKLE